MIQITPQMRVLVAIDAVDGRKGTDSLAQLCQEKLAEDSFFRLRVHFSKPQWNRHSLAHLRWARILAAAEAALEKGRFRWWPEADQPAKSLESYEAQLLLAAGDVSRVRAVPMWKRDRSSS